MRGYYARAPSGCNISRMRIHLLRGTCKALPSYGALLKATTVTADFGNLVVTAALIRHVCTRYDVKAWVGTKEPPILIVLAHPAGAGFPFPLIINTFVSEWVPNTCKAPRKHRPWCETHLYQRRFGFKRHLSDTDIRLTAITAGGKKRPQRP